jgi:hypothetical protein
MKRLLGALIFAGIVTTLAPSAAQAGARVYVRVGPPTAIVEVRTAAPSPHHVWVAGYHRWDGGVTTKASRSSRDSWVTSSVMPRVRV